jgi:hypothetical protein
MTSRAFSLLSALALSALLTFGQGGLATVTGTVTDQTGAVVANVTVRATHLATGTLLTAATSGTGNYTLTNLPIGGYEINVEQPGFKAVRREGLTLGAQQTLRIDVQLEVGSTTESVTVTAEASMMKTDSSDVTHNITMREIQNLPITPVSGQIRDPFSVAQLIPGVRYVPGTNTAQMLINGLPQGSVQYRIEGQVMGNSRDAHSMNTQQVQPSVDSIEQVAIVTSNYAAEYGSVAGALFNVTMRSGTNQYHGSVYDYAVNEVLNAHDPGVHLRNKVRRHDWGLTFGGPVKIPKLYNGTNKTFFFAGWEYYNQRQVTTVGSTLPTVPIQAYRDGDFSRLIALSGNQNLRIGTGATQRDYIGPTGSTVQAGTIFDPRSTTQVICRTAVSQDCGGEGSLRDFRTPFPGNRVPTTMFDRVATNIQNKYIPLPQGSQGGPNGVINNYLNPFENKRLSIIPSIKLDQNLSTKGRLSAYWQMTKTEAPISSQFGAEGFNDTITTNLGTYQTSNSLRVNYDHTVSASLQFHLGASMSLFDWSNAALVTNYDPAQDIGLTGLRLARNFPRFAANTQTTATGVGLGGMNAMGPASQALQPERRPAGNTSLTWIKGNHTYKFGGDWRMDMLPTITLTNAYGSFGALGNGITAQPALQGIALSGTANVGFPYADFLMGSVRGFTMSTPIAYRVSKQQLGFYAQDAWRVKRGLTIDYGLRWDYGTYTKEDHGRNAGLSLTVPNPSAGGHPGGLIYESTCQCKFAKNYPYAFGPRLGFAYTLNQRTVFRGGIGISYGSTGTFGGFAQNSAASATQLTGYDNFKLQDGIPASINPQWPIYDPGLGHTPGTVIAPQALLDPNAGRPTRTYQWNLSLQREITRNFTVEASYVGNRGIWQDASGMVAHNVIGEDTLRRFGFTVGNAADQAILNSRLDRLTTAQQSTLQSRGVGLPYSGFPLTQTVIQSLRAFPQYNGAINPSSAPLGRSWYDALQVQVNKRYSHGLQVNSNFTWSKNLTANTLPDVFNPNYGNKDISANNLPWRFRLTFEYQVPTIPTGIPVFGNRLVSNVLRGWGVAMTLSYQPAFYLGRPASGATNPVSQWLGRGPGGAQLKKNPDGSFMNPWSVDWVDYDGVRRTDPIDINCHCFDPEKTIVLNPAVWESVPDAVWASDAQRIPFFRGVRLPQESGNISRNFQFGGDKHRFNLQVRAEFQNLLNRLLLPSSPQGGGLNFNTAPVAQSDGRYTSGFGSMGNLRSGTAYGAERSGMLVGRLTF